MKNRLSVWARNISPSPTLAVDAKAKALKAAGKDVCGFGTGEPDFDTPTFIKDACVDALVNKGATKYLNSSGLPALRKELASFYNTKKNLKDVKDTNIIVCPGGKFACYLSIMAVCSQGDEVIIPAPYWVSYPEMVKLAGAKPVFVYADDSSDFKVTAKSIKEALTDNTKLIILNSPSNPTGAVYSKEELAEIAQLAIEKDLFVLSDEIYEKLLYDGAESISIASLKDMQSRTIIASGFSKSYAMTGWRLGTVCAPDDIAKAISNLQSQTSSNATSFAQYGALAAMQNPEESQKSILKMLAKFDERRNKMLKGLNAIDGITCRSAKGAFYLFPNISSFGLSSTEFCSKLLEEELMAIVPGIAFGADDYVRFSYAVSDEVIDKGLERIARFCARLRK